MATAQTTAAGKPPAPEQRSYTSRTNTIRAARAVLGKDAQVDKDFTVTTVGEEFVWAPIGEAAAPKKGADGKAGAAKPLEEPADLGAPATAERKPRYDANDGQTDARYPDGTKIRCSPDNPLLFDGVLYGNKTRMNEAKRALERTLQPAKEVKEAIAPPEPAPAKAKKGQGRLHPSIKSVTSTDHKTVEIAAPELAGKTLHQGKADYAALTKKSAPEPAKVQRAPKPKVDKAAGKAKEAPAASDAPKAKAKAAKPAGDAPKRQTKQDQVEALLKRKSSATSKLAGATLDEICEATGWQKHSARGFIAGNLKKRGFEVVALKEGSTTRYSIAG